jgi:hypothetical protein
LFIELKRLNKHADLVQSAVHSAGPQFKSEHLLNAKSVKTLSWAFLFTGDGVVKNKQIAGIRLVAWHSWLMRQSFIFEIWVQTLA